MNKTLTGVLAGAAMLAGGCGGHAAHEAHEAHEAHGMERLAAQPPSPTGGVPSGAPAGTSPGTSSPSPGVGAGDLKRAAQAALAAVPGSTLVSIELEENGTRWEAHVIDRDGTEHQMDISGSKIVAGPSLEDDDAEDKAEHRKLADAVKVDYAQALDKVAATVPEGRITELNLDTEHGKPVWEADVVVPNGTKHEVAVDAVTGAATTTSATSAASSPSPATPS
ncbi:PepSY domain-containing protein [Actinomadura sp. ATCC 31491]|uniref:PepSY domain-containing protein n=1 Tax=Actinomadura luzonensis TaxID=2805427 RepID=A0ABT0G1I3_9ACTN|nr:PepSY domain-containing protein [Actinomadura luzonensis]MCK2218040.1 PepSY domain-containing protein [Actinomadura luzonensis]